MSESFRAGFGVQLSNLGGTHHENSVEIGSVLPGPTWFEALDILVAYIPMAWLGYILGGQGEATRNK